MEPRRRYAIQVEGALTGRQLALLDTLTVVAGHEPGVTVLAGELSAEELDEVLTTLRALGLALTRIETGGATVEPTPGSDPGPPPG